MHRLRRVAAGSGAGTGFRAVRRLRYRFVDDGRRDRTLGDRRRRGRRLRLLIEALAAAGADEWVDLVDLGEAAWAYQHRPAMSAQMKKRQEGLSEEVKGIAWKAQHRLCTRSRRLVAKGKLRQKVTTAIGRELLGFIWAIGVQVETEQRVETTEAHAA